MSDEMQRRCVACGRKWGMLACKEGTCITPELFPAEVVNEKNLENRRARAQLEQEKSIQRMLERPLRKVLRRPPRGNS